MPPIEVRQKALRNLEKLQPKQFAQVAKRLFGLCLNPFPHDSKKLHGLANSYRIDSGEFRVVYTVEDGVVIILNVGKRNDDEVYR